MDIYSINELKAFGNYNYTTKGLKQTIVFADINCKKETVGERKKDREDQWRLYAKAPIDEKKPLQLYPKVNFYGDVNLASLNPRLKVSQN